jgi:hypothetical protein
MELTLINRDSGVEVHAAGCGDVKKAIKSPFGQYDHYSFDYASRFQAWADYNADFLAEESGAWPLDFKPCTKALPVGEATEYEAEWAEEVGA